MLSELGNIQLKRKQMKSFIGAVRIEYFYLKIIFEKSLGLAPQLSPGKRIQRRQPQWIQTQQRQPRQRQTPQICLFDRFMHFWKKKGEEKWEKQLDIIKIYQ